MIGFDPGKPRVPVTCCPSLATTAAVEPVDMPATDGCPPAKNPRGFTLENWSPPATNPLGFLLVDTALLPATCSDVESVLSLAAEPLDALAVPEGTACLSRAGAPQSRPAVTHLGAVTAESTVSTLPVPLVEFFFV